MAYLEQSTRYVPYTDRPDGRWKYHVPAELDGIPLRARYVATLDRAFETYARWIDPMRDALRARASRRRRRTRTAPTIGDPRQGAGQPARSAARGDAVERRHLRHRPGLRGAAAADARAPARGGPRLRASMMLAELRKVIPAFLAPARCGPSAAAPGSSYLAETRDAIDGARASACSTASTPEPRRRGDAHRLRSRRRDEGRRRGALRRVRRCPTTSSWRSRAKLGAGGTGARPRGLRRATREPPPQARARLRAHQLPLRRARRLRRLPRSAAAPAAHARVAAAQRRATATPSRTASTRRARSSDWRARDGRLGRAPRRDRRRGPARVAPYAVPWRTACASTWR